MSRWRVPLAGLLAWLAVVAVGSTAVWWVISSVGQDLGPGRAASEVVPDVEPGRAGPSSQPPAATRSARPSGHPSGRHSGRPSTRPSASSPTPSAGQPSALPPTAGASGTPQATAPPPVATHQRTWSGRGGYVTVRCRGAQAGLVAAQPDSGYAVEAGDRGPERVEVSFTGRSEDGGRHVEVRAECVGGRPSFQVSTNGGGDG